MSRSTTGPDDPVALAPVAHDDGVVVPPGSAALLADFADGQSPRQAAWQSGVAVLDAVGSLADLFDQGACRIVARALPPPPPPPGPPPARPPGPTPGPPSLPAPTPREDLDPLPQREAQPVPRRR